jgi:hypothetical protein
MSKHPKDPIFISFLVSIRISVSVFIFYIYAKWMYSNLFFYDSSLSDSIFVFEKNVKYIYDIMKNKVPSKMYIYD